MGGGPGTAIYKSIDGGENWKKLVKELPTTMGKIEQYHLKSLMSYMQLIELNRRTGGVYRSENQGEEWVKMSDLVGGTGPHYYQELYVSPHNFDELYLVTTICSILQMEVKHFLE